MLHNSATFDVYSLVSQKICFDHLGYENQLSDFSSAYTKMQNGTWSRRDSNNLLHFLALIAI